ncbi:ABC transporter ATP-binding protein [Cohaesibacter celericrescens]|uniref:ABC transporter ATP-binding protein n=1 Tax=Cohaesibacter celericrescens TaxID=2067669 RepID=UPI003562C9C6
MTRPQTDRGPLGVETVGMTMKFGAFTALDNVSIKITPGSFHALLGENGAGKSTLVKCIMGFNRPTSGQLLIQDREVTIPNPNAAHAHGLGMVYQHFTLVPSLTGAENLVINRSDIPQVIHWATEAETLEAFMQTMPFDVPLHVPVKNLAAGEKQKLELLKQLYLGRQFLILDEPTSVLTPAEADELLGMVRDMTLSKGLTVLMITHKFREVTAYADDVSVLRRGQYVGGGKVADMSHADMAAMMIGEKELSKKDTRKDALGDTVLAMSDILAIDRSGLKPIQIARLNVRAGEIVGIAGVSGNGQTELMELLAGQRPYERGNIEVKGEPYTATRKEARKSNVRYLPEEPLHNACAPKMSVAQNISFRDFDVAENAKPTFWLNNKQINAKADHLVGDYNVKTTSIDSPIADLSGGNVQRAVLARELTGDVDLLIISNPCFGLDFSAVAEIRARIMAARNGGTAVLLISEDLDEILELSDRVIVMSEGKVAFETPIGTADIAEIGQYMAGHA